MPIQNSISNAIKGSIINGGGPAADFSTKSLSFDGVDEYISTSEVYSELDGESKATFSVWVKPSVLDTIRIITHTPKNTTASNSQFLMFLRNNGSVDFSVSSASLYARSNTGVITAGAWNHIFICIDFVTPGNVQMFVNGSPELSVQNMNSLTTFPVSTGELYIGEEANGYQSLFSGEIDEFAIWSGQDLSSDVATIYNNGKPADLTGTKPTSWYRAGENSTFSYPQILMPEDTNKDKVSKYSLNFDGSFDLITMGNVLNLQDDGTEPYSISCWFKTTNTGLQILVSKQLNASPYNGYNLYLDGNRIKFFLGTLSGSAYINGQSASLIGSITDGNWHHVVLTYDGTQDITGFNLYYDNSSTAITAIGNNTPSNLQSNTDFMIGSRGIASGSYGLSFDGNIDEVAFWTTELSSTTVSGIYNNGVPNDIASLYPTRLEGYWKLGEEAKLTNTWLVPNSALSNFSKYSFNFDGTDDYIEIPDADNLSFGDSVTDSPFSISAWINMTDATQFRILSKLDGTNFEYALFTTSTDLLYFYIYDANSLNRRGRYSTNPVTSYEGQWIHICATYDGQGGNGAFNGMKVYLNGNRYDNTNLSVNSYTAMHNTNAPLEIGKYISTNADGLIDEVAVFNSELSQTEVTSIYNGGKPKDLSGFSPVSWWRMGEEATYDGTSNQFTIPDQGSGGNTGTGSNLMTLDTLVGNAPQYSNAGTSLGLDIFDRHGDAPKSKDNTVSFNMEEADIVEDTP